MCIVMFYPHHQLRVSPLHESIQVCSCWGGHRDQVTIRPYLQPHQSNKGPQRFVDLKKTTLGMQHYTPTASSYCRTVCSTVRLYWYGICIEIAKKQTHHVDKVDNLKYFLSHLLLIPVHLHILKHHKTNFSSCFSPVYLIKIKFCKPRGKNEKVRKED